MSLSFFSGVVGPWGLEVSPAIVWLFDFLHIAWVVIPSQTQPFVFIGTIKETLLFAAVVYWMFTFAFSTMSLRLGKKLGVGER